MVTRRELIGTALVAVVGSTAGCSKVPFFGNQPLEFEATRATVPDATLAETGYEEVGVSENVREQTFEVGGQTQDVVVTNWRAEYDKAIDLSEAGLPTDQQVRAAAFTVLATPQVSVLGKSFNPIEEMGTPELAEKIQGSYDGMEALERVGEESATVAGRQTTVGEFRTGARLAEVGTSVELALHIAEAVEVGDDFLVAVGSYPARVRDAERESVFAMMDAIEQPG